jgi:hypothetical protein
MFFLPLYAGEIHMVFSAVDACFLPLHGEIHMVFSAVDACSFYQYIMEYTHGLQCSGCMLFLPLYYGEIHLVSKIYA